jgi:hypothetical protein
MSDSIESRLQRLGLRVVGGQERSPEELAANTLDAAAGLLKATRDALRRATVLHRGGQYENAIQEYRNAAKHCWWLSQHWARSVWVVFGAAASCATKLGRRSQAGRFLAVAELQDSEIVEGSRKLRSLMGVPNYLGPRKTRGGGRHKK